MKADATIDQKVLDLYGITDDADRRRILGSAPAPDDADIEAAETPMESAGESDDNEGS